MTQKITSTFLLFFIISLSSSFAKKELSFYAEKVDTVEIKSDTTKLNKPKWTAGGSQNILFTQAAFSEWQSGGENYLGGLGTLNVFISRSSKKSVWTNTVNLEYGSNHTFKNDKRAAKTADLIDFITDYQIKFSKKWSFRTSLNFKTQFAPGYKDDKDTIMRSRFMAPGYIINNNGISYQPKKWISIQASPLTSKIVLVLDQDIADRGEYGVEKAKTDSNGDPIKGTGENVRYEFGGTIKIMMNKEVAKNITIVSELNLFSNYLENAKNVDFEWKTKVDFKINKYFSTTLLAHFLYDDNIASVLQFKEVLGVGFNYKF
ncbi:MAG: DUF3078 domain-containing protein [Bacteroidales bacterium]|jgi:hypothetical protein|nr:DUF3078 domain-containing protein [Bacteroidales bacterium]